ncbi:MAG: leucine-rich repeat domain-containing protein [Clostridiales bacterium]|jgi:hypothetical protein|nr:leucine-rich repeat domain-containing protein [Clostridiales bacterium]
MEDIKFIVTPNKVLIGYKCLRDDLGKVHTVFLPDEIEVIGERSMMNFTCARLVMPRSLNAIWSNAFKGARIDEIDFNGCNLLNIDSEAFCGCFAKTVLPDSIRSLGKEAAANLRLVKEERLRLPDSLTRIGLSAVDLRNVKILDVDERLVTRDSGFEIFLLMENSFYVKWVILYMRRDGKLAYRVPLPVGAYFSNSLINEKGFDCYAYDDWIANEGKPIKIIMAAFRVMFNEGLKETKELRRYVLANFSSLMEGFEEEIDTIKLYTDAGLITNFRLKQLLENATKKNNVEVAAAILELINSRGSSVKSLHL